MLNIKLITPIGLSWDVQANRITLPGKDSIFQILPYHINIISTLISGKIILHDTLNIKEINVDKETINSTNIHNIVVFFVHQGIVEYSGTFVNILGDIEYHK